MIAAIDTAEGVLLVDVDEEQPLGPGSELPRRRRAPRRPAARRRDRRRGRDRGGAARPPPAARDLRDGGATWREAGGGLPAGFAVAIAEDDPDRMLYAARNRLYVSANGGVFWRSLPFELPDIER